MTNPTPQDEHWKVFVLLLQEIAIDKYGTGYQLHIAKESGLARSNVSRIFSLKYSVKLDTFLKIAKAIKVNLFFEDQDSSSDLNLAMERAMSALGRRPNQLPRN